MSDPRYPSSVTDETGPLPPSLRDGLSASAADRAFDWPGQERNHSPSAVPANGDGHHWEASDGRDHGYGESQLAAVPANGEGHHWGGSDGRDQGYGESQLAAVPANGEGHHWGGSDGRDQGYRDPSPAARYVDPAYSSAATSSAPRVAAGYGSEATNRSGDHGSGYPGSYPGDPYSPQSYPPPSHGPAGSGYPPSPPYVPLSGTGTDAARAAADAARTAAPVGNRPGLPGSSTTGTGWRADTGSFIGGSTLGSSTGRSPGRPRSQTGVRSPRRARLLIRHIDPWSTLKFSLVLSVALFFVWLVAVGVLYGVLDGMGVFDRINSLYDQLSGSPGDHIVTPGLVLGISTLIGAINIVLMTALATIGSFVYNICADLVGGLEITLAERD